MPVCEAKHAEKKNYSQDTHKNNIALTAPQTQNQQQHKIAT
jgi:hypothetical protein